MEIKALVLEKNQHVNLNKFLLWPPWLSISVCRSNCAKDVMLMSLEVPHKSGSRDKMPPTKTRLQQCLVFFSMLSEWIPNICWNVAEYYT